MVYGTTHHDRAVQGQEGERDVCCQEKRAGGASRDAEAVDEKGSAAESSGGDLRSITSGSKEVLSVIIDPSRQSQRDGHI